MQRFFLDGVNLGSDRVDLSNIEIVHQLVNVLRAKPGDEVIFFDGVQFVDFKYRIDSISRKNVVFSFVKRILKPKENYNLILFQALPNKISKIEEIIKRGTEVGYSKFIFFAAERSQRLNLSQNKIKRFNRIIKEASEQSGRNKVPELVFSEKLDFKDISGKSIFLHTDKTDSKKLSELKVDFTCDVNVFVGPEGGFSQKEVNEFLKNNFLKVNLGGNILRTENAGILVGFYLLQQRLAFCNHNNF